MLVRRFRPGDEAALAQVACSSVHQLAIRDYTPEQHLRDGGVLESTKVTTPGPARKTTETAAGLRCRSVGKTWRRSADDGIPAAILALTRDPMARDLLMEMALARDYGLCCAVFGTEAFRVLANDPPGLLVVDIDIPDGRALVRSLRADERWRGIPLIGLALPTNTQVDLIRDALVYFKPDLIGLEEAVAARFEPDEEDDHAPYLFGGSSTTTAWH